MVVESAEPAERKVMFDLSARSVLVTGGTKGIGRGIATVFARAGANVAVAARSPREYRR
ncbi:Oxidoreductase ucpA [Mycobacteroides abscessus]|nr:Oxidoreductase ucpA [Mycobacteroides abscessus]